MNSLFRCISAFYFVFLFLSGCGSSDSNKLENIYNLNSPLHKTSCDVPKEEISGSCTEFWNDGVSIAACSEVYGYNANETERVKEQCGLNGTNHKYSTAPCPIQNFVAGCKQTSSYFSLNKTNIRYYYTLPESQVTPEVALESTNSYCEIFLDDNVENSQTFAEVCQ